MAYGFVWLDATPIEAAAVFGQRRCARMEDRTAADFLKKSAVVSVSIREDQR